MAFKIYSTLAHKEDWQEFETHDSIKEARESKEMLEATVTTHDFMIIKDNFNKS